MRFIPNTEPDQKAMLQTIGLNSLDELFSHIDGSLLLKEPLPLPRALSEMELSDHMRTLSSRNLHSGTVPSFLGAGAYNHFIPAAVDALSSRGEFLTAYTPYQAEVSQGTLQSIYEFQTLMARLTGMDVANASMYDGATAVAEAANLSIHSTRRKEILVSEGVDPNYRAVLDTYARAMDFTVKTVSLESGRTSKEALTSAMTETTAAFIVQSPNFFGLIEELADFEPVTHEKRAMYVAVVSNPMSMGLLKPPGDFGTDIVVGEAQGFGCPTAFGGPYIGFFAATKKLLKKIPGRLSGATVDDKGRKGFTLTLQAREQHIRREKATSNICSNEALLALRVSIYLSLLGKCGLSKTADSCARKANYAFKRITELSGFEPVFDAPFFNEFAVKCPKSPEELNQALLKRGIIGGLALGNHYPGHKNDMLFCVTEVNTSQQIDRLVKNLAEIAGASQ